MTFHEQDMIENDFRRDGETMATSTSLTIAMWTLYAIIVSISAGTRFVSWLAIGNVKSYRKAKGDSPVERMFNFALIITLLAASLLAIAWYLVSGHRG